MTAVIIYFVTLIATMMITYHQAVDLVSPLELNDTEKIKTPTFSIVNFTNNFSIGRIFMGIMVSALVFGFLSTLPVGLLIWIALSSINIILHTKIIVPEAIFATLVLLSFNVGVYRTPISWTI
jgi:hypothetical protein